MLGNDCTMGATGVGTITFQRESFPPLKSTEVLYVLGLKKSLVSVSYIEDRGFEVLFRGGWVLLYPKGGSITSARVIGVQQGKLYKLVFETIGALTCGTNNKDLCEL